MPGITVSQETMMVTPTLTQMLNYLSIRTEDGPAIAVLPPKDDKPNYGDAAVMAAANKMFNMLVEIQKTLLFSKDVIDLTEISDRISLIFEKIAAEGEA